MFDPESIIYLVTYRLIVIHPPELVIPALTILLLILILAAQLLRKCHKIASIIALIMVVASVVLLFPQIYRQYLLTCLESEERELPLKAYDILNQQEYPIDFYTSVLNNRKESPYLEAYVASLLANKLMNESKEHQDIVLSKLDDSTSTYWDASNPSPSPRFFVQKYLNEPPNAGRLPTNQ
jgi:hypothetical protein